MSVEKDIPKGVTVSHDDEALLQNRCKWSLKRMISGVDPEGDADFILATLMRPFAERYCDAIDDDADVVLLGRRTGGETESPYETPHAALGRGRQMWDMFRDELVSLCGDMMDAECTFTVRYDQMYGGPVLSVLEDDVTTVYGVSLPDRFKAGKNSCPPPDFLADGGLAAPKVGRNDPCPCGSGKKYKKCCGRD